MGWIESPPYFCAASETARDVAVDYIKTEVGFHTPHKFESYTHTRRGARVEGVVGGTGGFWYLVEVYVDDFMSFVIPTSEDHLGMLPTP